jgi:hypothetical protein
MPRYPYRDLGTGLGRDFRNKLNANFDDIEADLRDIQNDLNTKDSAAHARMTQIENDSIERDNDLDARIDNIVANAGSSNTEIVDARNDSVNNVTYPTLKDRLDDTSDKIGILNEVVVNIKQFEHLKVATADGYDWKPVFDYIHSQALTAFVPKGTFDIYGRLTNRRIIGVGRQRSIINQKTLSEPVLEIDGLTYIADLGLKHDSLPSSEIVPNGVGILIKNLSDGSVLERLEITNTTSGIHLADSGTGHIYSSSIRDIRITRFTHSGVYIGGAGHTGSVWSNIYVVNWDNYLGDNDPNNTKLTAKYGFYFKGINEGVYQQLNIEHGIYENGLVINGCANFDAKAIHFEGYEAKGSYNALIYIDGSNTNNVNINGVTVVYSKFDATNFVNGYALMNINYSPKVKLTNVKTANNTLVGSPTLRKFFGAGALAEGAAIYAENITIESGEFASSNYFPPTTTPVLRKYNDTLYYWEEGGKKRVLGTGIPSTGKWYKGDKVIIQEPTAGSYSEYICTQGGHFNPPASSVTTTVPTAFVNDIVVSSKGSFVVGDEITIVGSSRTFVITNIYTSGDQTHFVLDKNIEVTVTDATVQYATPVFKGAGLLET